VASLYAVFAVTGPHVVLIFIGSSVTFLTKFLSVYLAFATSINYILLFCEFFDDRILEWRSLSMEESIILKKITKLVPVTWGNFLNKMQVEGVIVPQLPEDIMESVVRFFSL
jgi:hypothetical protein